MIPGIYGKAWQVSKLALFCAALAVAVGLMTGSMIEDARAGKTRPPAGVATKTNEQETGSCGAVDQHNFCAPVTVKVPAGKRYNVTVFSSFTAESTSASGVTYCPWVTGGSINNCVSSKVNFVSLAAGYAESGANSGEIVLPPGTYTVSTMLFPRPSASFVSLSNLNATTMVQVRDAAVRKPPIG
jgi:hypothetical protein